MDETSYLLKRDLTMAVRVDKSDDASDKGIKSVAWIHIP